MRMLDTVYPKLELLIITYHTRMPMWSVYTQPPF